MMHPIGMHLGIRMNARLLNPDTVVFIVFGLLILLVVAVVLSVLEIGNDGWKPQMPEQLTFRYRLKRMKEFFRSFVN